jgi:WD40 repeat protein
MITRFCYLVLFALSPLVLAAEEEAPRLIIDPQGHSGSVKKLLFNEQSEELISLGDDKAIRFWDIRSGELLRTMRGQISDGPEGKLYNADLSSDGRWLAVGGYLADHAIRIIDLESGSIAAVLKAHENTVHSLTFSDDDRWLASGSSDTNVRVWDLAGLGADDEVLEITESELLEGHTEVIYAIDFAPGGLLLVSGADDDTMILWEREDAESGFEPKAVLEEHTDDIGAAAFTSDGLYLVSGGYDARLLLWDGSTGEFIKAIDEDMGHAITSLSLPPEADRVLASSQTSSAGTTAIYNLTTTEKLLTFPHHNNSVRASAWHPSLNVVATSGGDDNDIYLWHPDTNAEAEVEAGDILHHLIGQGRSVWAAAFSESRELVAAFGQSTNPDNELLEEDLEGAFDFSLFEISDEGEFRRTLTESDGVVLEKTDGITLAVGEEGSITVNKETDGTIRSFSYSPDAELIFVGTDYSLRSYNATPNDEGEYEAVHDFVGHTAATWALSPSPDGRFLVSASDDQTLRLWNLQAGTLLASLFVARDREWVCWTPSGHYQASSGGEQYIGWHFNRGPDKMAEFFPSSVFRDAFHHPELVRRTIELADFDAALAEVGAAPVNLDEMMPPQIEWVLPGNPRETLEGTEMTVQAELMSPNGDLQELKLLLNGKAIHHYDLSDGTEFSYEEAITLEPGENRLTLFARNIHAGHTSEERVITVAPPAPTDDAPELEELLKPNLYMLAVGVSEFANAEIPALEYCDDDASAMAEFFTAQEGGLFAKAEVKLLTNADATEANIQEGLDWLERSATQKDFVVLFLAAHGLNDDKGNFYMVPHDCDLNNLRSTGVAWEDFGEILGNLPSRTLMFLDTCHSGRLGANLFSMAKGETGGKTRSLTGLKSAFDNTEAIRELTSDEVGVVIMAASTGNESSLEHPDWGHGAFTASVLAGMKGGADINKDGIVHLLELDFFVSEKVKELSEGAQHPTTVKPSTISRLPVAAVMDGE